MFNTVIQGWINYYGRFYKSMLYPTFRHLNDILVRWAMRTRIARTSADNRLRSRVTDSLLGVMSSLPLPCRSTRRRMSNPRNEKPSST